MQLSGATRLGHCTCLTRPSVVRHRRFSNNGTAYKTCMKSAAFQVEVDAPEGVPAEEVMKRFKNESRRVNVIQEVRRRRYFENHQDMLKRKEKQKHFNKRMAKFEKFTPRLSDKIDNGAAVPFGEMFGQGVDDLIGQNGFGPDSVFGSFDSPFARKIQNPDSVQEQSKERSIGRWGSRKPSDNGAPQNRSKGNNDPGAPLTARARKAAQAANAQGQQSVSAPGKPVPSKNQPKQRQPIGKNAPGKPGTAAAQNGKSGTAATQSGKPGAAAAQNGKPGPAAAQSGKPGTAAPQSDKPGTAAPQSGNAAPATNGSPKQQPNGAKKQKRNPNQRKKQSRQNKTGSPPPAKPANKKQPVAA